LPWNDNWILASAELHLLVAFGRAGVERCRASFLFECARFGRASDLVEERDVGPAEKAILFHRAVPDQFLEVIDRIARGQIDLGHRGQAVEQRRECVRGALHYLRVTVLGSRAGCRAALEKRHPIGMRGFDRFPSRGAKNRIRLPWAEA